MHREVELDEASVLAQPDTLLEQIAGLLRRAGCFPGLHDYRLIAEGANWFAFPGGSTLFKQAEAADSLYVVLSGLLGAYVADQAGRERLVSRIGPGEIIGEMGCLTGEPRSATVRALRSCELLGISRQHLESVASRDPGILVSVCRTVIGRLRKAQEGKASPHWPRTFCVLPLGERIDGRIFALRLRAAFRRQGSVFLVSHETCADFTTDKLFALETEHDAVIYLADLARPAWSRLCLQQADSVLIVARGDGDARFAPAFREHVQPGIPVELVLLWDTAIEPGRTETWLRLLRPRRHFHVRSGDDIGRLARLLTGKGFGLVLSGGGARGFAHVGVAKALLDRHIAVDAVAGTSMGAVVGAAVAMEWDYATMLRRIDEFSRVRFLSQLTMPIRSLLSGRGLRDSLDDWFGAWEIPDTPIPYACVSTNLSAGAVAVHQRGKLRTWTRASASIPGVFPPVLDEDFVHVDGGILNNLPTDIIRDMGAGYVVAVDIGSPSPAAPAGRLSVGPNILELLVGVSTISSKARAAMVRHECDLLLTPRVRDVGLFNFRGYRVAIEAGYEAAMERMNHIQRRLGDAAVAHALTESAVIRIAAQDLSRSGLSPDRLSPDPAPAAG